MSASFSWALAKPRSPWSARSQMYYPASARRSSSPSAPRSPLRSESTLWRLVIPFPTPAVSWPVVKPWILWRAYLTMTCLSAVSPVVARPLPAFRAQEYPCAICKLLPPRCCVPVRPSKRSTRFAVIWTVSKVVGWRAPQKPGFSACFCRTCRGTGWRQSPPDLRHPTPLRGQRPLRSWTNSRFR